jgi:hypothetical protein
MVVAAVCYHLEAWFLPTHYLCFFYPIFIDAMMSQPPKPEK